MPQHVQVHSLLKRPRTARSRVLLDSESRPVICRKLDHRPPGSVHSFELPLFRHDPPRRPNSSIVGQGRNTGSVTCGWRALPAAGVQSAARRRSASAAPGSRRPRRRRPRPARRGRALPPPASHPAHHFIVLGFLPGPSILMRDLVEVFPETYSGCPVVAGQQASRHSAKFVVSLVM